MGMEPVGSRYMASPLRMSKKSINMHVMEHFQWQTRDPTQINPSSLLPLDVHSLHVIYWTRLLSFLGRSWMNIQWRW